MDRTERTGREEGVVDEGGKAEGGGGWKKEGWE